MEEVKGFIVITQYVGGLPPFKAEVFIGKVKENMTPTKPDGWNIIINPTRILKENKMEIFKVGEDNELEAVEKYLFNITEKRILNPKENKTQ